MLPMEVQLDSRRELRENRRDSVTQWISALKQGESDQGRDDRLNDGPVSRVQATAVSPDGRTLATARSEAAEGRTRGRVELRDAATGKSLRQTHDQPHALSGVVYSPDSKWLL